ncbi:uncharacterized protein LOC125225757 [Leguminivora glycinivorella]|uniref:uncharacterized protein LOC125225757 n=1 Tax=Leguminivora glycinivorella TaxID=1035111 RepID=UPI0020106AE2|nr:uncharacterized protein LOC125225757 [Leguminivora glycinivorella]
MANAGTCVAALCLVMVVVQSARIRRSEYLFDYLDDASIAGDHIIGFVGDDCSDDDSSESVELGYVIINKREAPEEPHARSSPSEVASDTALPLPNTNNAVFV